MPRLLIQIALLSIVLWLSACESDQSSIDEVATFRADQVLVNQPVDDDFRDAVGRCPLYEKSNFRRIGDGRADALADTNEGHFRIVLVGDSFDLFVKQYDEKTMDCVGELPPFNTVFVLSSGSECGLVEDESDGARAYGLDYSSLVMEKLIDKGECR